MNELQTAKVMVVREQIKAESNMADNIYSETHQHIEPRQVNKQEQEKVFP
jgi:hypothetical protein